MDILPSCFQKDFLAFSEKFVFENTSLSVTNTTVSSPTGHSTRSHASQKQQQRSVLGTRPRLPSEVSNLSNLTTLPLNEKDINPHALARKMAQLQGPYNKYLQQQLQLQQHHHHPETLQNPEAYSNNPFRQSGMPRQHHPHQPQQQGQQDSTVKQDEYHAAADDDNNNNKDNEYDDNPNEIYGPPRPTVAESRSALQEAIADGNSQLQYLRRTFFEQQLITNTLAEQCQGLAEKIQVNMFKLYQLGGPEQIQEHQRQDVVDGTAHHSGGGDRVALNMQAQRIYQDIVGGYAPQQQHQQHQDQDQQVQVQQHQQHSGGLSTALSEKQGRKKGKQRGRGGGGSLQAMWQE
ncbi:hypothetical protein CH63R_14592 [Colletotrichum higginsianum IMI 349063]|uniref:Uncharacterized protein n=1 Tax=Colletotrichum higginsianum (strain IMI 349063) TaxID=759273 RepID=A0A1B7XQH7_COLHI|nr:hypothetical protein CH63R_14592 [Colletotrichum higginsianum IMI 349063]OBR02020.1 hypothetical protein CH63R_14592 [Colletotrichum higginsianum IMI 349063]